MKHHLVILSLILYLGGVTLAHAVSAYCPSDNSTISVLLAKDKEKGDKKEGGGKNPEEDCE